MKSDKPFILLIALWILFILFDIALLAAIIYVAWHFISKLW